MSTVLKDVLAANEKYAAGFGDKARLALPPGRRFAILTCMDARLDPAKFAGLAEGDWLTIKGQAESVVADVRHIRNHPLVPGDSPIYGYVYDVKTGRLVEVPSAKEIGRAREALSPA